MMTIAESGRFAIHTSHEYRIKTKKGNGFSNKMAAKYDPGAYQEKALKVELSFLMPSYHDGTLQALGNQPLTALIFFRAVLFFAGTDIFLTKIMYIYYI